MDEQFFSVLFSAILGACLGSFANVAAIRLHEMVSLHGRSKCPACDAPIRPRHLVPIFSWLALRGRCADCGAAIHIQYPIVETLCAALVVLAAIRHDPFSGALAPFLFETFLSVSLVVVSVMDARWKELPMEVLGLIAVVAVGWNVADGSAAGTLQATLQSLGLGVAVGAGFFGIQWALSRGKWIGSGDVWFGAMIGTVLGWPRTAFAIYLAYLIGGTCVGVLYLCRAVKRGMHVPFAPALSLGLLSVRWFEPVLKLWIDYFLV
ncbi:prepilin peptidase [Candidatus Uhrbacteria bacterium]|nr:prepilin peptidase [Candidatus Uhrbacteria bacterium]